MTNRSVPPQARNRRLGFLLIATFAAMLIGSVFYIILYSHGAGA